MVIECERFEMDLWSKGVACSGRALMGGALVEQYLGQNLLHKERDSVSK